MSMTAVPLLVALLVPSQAGAAPAASSMQADVTRLLRAAEALTGTWPSQAPPPVSEVAVVARHGHRVVPLLMALLSDDSDAERDRNLSADRSGCGNRAAYERGVESRSDHRSQARLRHPGIASVFVSEAWKAVVDSQGVSRSPDRWLANERRC